MPNSEKPLEHSHAGPDIAQRLAAPNTKSYLRDAIYGGIDGAITTFAVVAGVSGAGLSPTVIIILGLANLVGDGFSMAAGNFLGTRAENQQYERFRSIEKKHIALSPDGEREEVRQILIAQGYEGKLLEELIGHITANEERWIELMLQHEYGVSKNQSAPLPAALTTLISFLAVGSIPLLPFVVDLFIELQHLGQQGIFLASTAMTALAFSIVGAIKSRYVDQHWFSSAMETLLVGAIAAALAYFVGWGLGFLNIEA